MNLTEKHTKAFETFWAFVASAKDKIVQYGHTGFDPDAEEKWSAPFEDAFNNIGCYLRPVRQAREYFLPIHAPGRYPVIWAESAHEGLLKFLNPPEALFGLTHVLSSQEFQQLEQQALEELAQIRLRMRIRQPKMNVRTNSNLLRGALLTLHQFDSKTPQDGPFSQTEIAKLLTWCQSRVSRTMKNLFPDGMAGYARMCRTGMMRKGFLRKFDNGTFGIEAADQPDDGDGGQDD
jgi:hypothetical protein